LILCATFIGAFGALYFKKGACKLEFTVAGVLGNRDLLLGVLFYGGATVLHVFAVRGGPLSVIYPLVSTSYIWVCILSVKKLGESMNRLKWAGVGLIILGVSVIGLAGV